MKFTLIGMSTVGKTYWSQRFAENGFERIDLDDMIMCRVKEYMSNAQIQSQEATKWLGLPNEQSYPENEKKFMQFEIEAFKDALAFLEKKQKNDRIIVDTGGSLIYTPPQYWQVLKTYTPIIYLKMDKNIHQTLVDNYLRDPRSMIWNGYFAPQPHETTKEAFSRCYTNLIEAREKLYEIYADYTIEYAQHRDKTMDIEGFLSLLKI